MAKRLRPRKHGLTARRHGSGSPRLEGKALAELLKADSKVLKVLDKHGVTFCAGCYLTLTSPLKKVAAYHAVPDLGAFLRDLSAALRR